MKPNQVKLLFRVLRLMLYLLMWPKVTGSPELEQEYNDVCKKVRGEYE